MESQVADPGCFVLGCDLADGPVVTPDTPDNQYLYEPVERFGEGLTTQRPWNQGALAAVERLNGRVAMLGFLAALIGEAISGKGIVGQLGYLVRWLLG
jgi:hypothetical protein